MRRMFSHPRFRKTNAFLVLFKGSAISRLRSAAATGLKLHESIGHCAGSTYVSLLLLHLPLRVNSFAAIVVPQT